LGTSSDEELEQKVIQVGNSAANTATFSDSFQATTHPFAPSTKETSKVREGSTIDVSPTLLKEGRPPDDYI
jgi:hypothetical protein